MLYNVAQLLKDPVGSVRDYMVDDTLAAAGEPWESCHIRGPVRLLRTHRGILVTGDFTTTVAATCGRCLEPTELPLELELEEEFFPTIDINSGFPTDVPDDAGPFTIDSHHIIDLSEAFRQAIVVSTPISPLCREDCRGLCPVCGVDRNLQDCDCERTEDVRWSSLGPLLDDGGTGDRI